MSLTLYQRDDCHLCDQALQVLAQARVDEPHSVFIDDDATLEARYGLRVPVLRAADGRELDWPFDAAGVRAWLAICPAPGTGR
ncbi:glutaredoxin family protein [Xanthomonas sacchari]|uniref:glutaredoxin family protein n=1 Tax=Xanthomonas sacchari TaxID=56458 RepID=UPI00058232D3|nr:glutaredoxin family protein [Xanthomonas sacchari]AJC47433.1 glutaredoxin [Xanthomonas sacchari]